PTAYRTPLMAAEVNRLRWECGLMRVRSSILDVADQPTAPDALARQFIDLVFAPHQLRALLGEDRGVLIQGIPERVAWGVRMVGAAGLLG
ncbi:TetR/AcrR family transcriptional regulator, partial [Pseudomonas syringae]